MRRLNTQKRKGDELHCILAIQSADPKYFNMKGEVQKLSHLRGELGESGRERPENCTITLLRKRKRRKSTRNFGGERTGKSVHSIGPYSGRKGNPRTITRGNRRRE